MHIKVRSVYSAILYLVLFEISYIIVSLLLHFPWPERAFIGESSPITWLSSTLLVISATFAMVIHLYGKETYIWWIIATGNLVMAMDETFMWHERIKESILFNIFDGDIDAMGFSGELVILLYGLSGVIVFYFLFRKVHIKFLRGILLGVVSSGLCAITLDVSGANPVMEECLEILTETGFVVFLLLYLDDLFRLKVNF